MWSCETRDSVTPEHLADLAQGQLLVVVERHDELLALGQAGDRLGERLAHLGLVERVGRLDALRVLERVEERDLVALARGRPELVERGDRGARDVDERLLELLRRDPDLRRDLVVRGRPAELRLELADRPLDLPRPRPHRAGHPVERPQLVDDRAADARDRVGLELDVALGVVPVDRAHQAEQPVRDEVGLVDVRREPRAEPARHVLDERRVVHDQAIAERLVARPSILEPQAPAVGFPGHEERIRASDAFSSVKPTQSCPSRRRGPRPPRRSPTARGSRRHRRSPRTAAVSSENSTGIDNRPTPG